MFLFNIILIKACQVQTQINQINYQNIYAVVGEKNIYKLDEFANGQNFQSSITFNATMQLAQTGLILSAQQLPTTIKTILYSTVYSESDLWMYQSALLTISEILNQYAVYTAPYTAYQPPNYTLLTEFSQPFQCYTIKYLNKTTLVINCAQNTIVQIVNGQVSNQTFITTQQTQLYNIMQTSIYQNTIVIGYPSLVQPGIVFLQYNQSILQVQSQISLPSLYQMQIHDRDDIYFLFTLTNSSISVYDETQQKKLSYQIKNCYDFDVWSDSQYGAFSPINVVFLCSEDGYLKLESYVYEYKFYQFFMLLSAQNTDIKYTRPLSASQVIPLQITREYILINININGRESLITLKSNFNKYQISTNTNYQLFNSAIGLSFILVNPYDPIAITYSQQNQSTQLALITQPYLYLTLPISSSAVNGNLTLNYTQQSQQCQVQIQVQFLQQDDFKVYLTNQLQQPNSNTYYPIPVTFNLNNYFNGPNLQFDITNKTNTKANILTYRLIKEVDQKIDNNTYKIQPFQSVIFSKNAFIYRSNITILFVQYQDFILSGYLCQNSINNLIENRSTQCQFMGNNTFSDQISGIEIGQIYVTQQNSIGIYCVNIIFQNIVSCYTILYDSSNQNSSISDLYSTAKLYNQIQIGIAGSNLCALLTNNTIVIYSLLSKSIVQTISKSNFNVSFDPQYFITNYVYFGNVLFINNVNTLLIVQQSLGNQLYYYSFKTPCSQYLFGLAQKNLYIQCEDILYSYQIVLLNQIELLNTQNIELTQIISQGSLDFIVGSNIQDGNQTYYIIQNKPNSHNSQVYTIPVGSGINGPSITLLDNLFVLNYIQNSTLWFLLFDPSQKLIVVPQQYNNSQQITNGSYNLEVKTLTNSIQKNFTINIYNPGILISVQVDSLKKYQNFTQTLISQSFQLDQSQITQGQIINYYGQCKECSSIQIQQLYQSTNYTCNIQNVDALLNFQAGVLIQTSDYLYLNQSKDCSISIQQPSYLSCPILQYLNQSNLIVSICNKNPTGAQSQATTFQFNGSNLTQQSTYSLEIGFATQSVSTSQYIFVLNGFADTNQISIYYVTTTSFQLVDTIQSKFPITTFSAYEQDNYQILLYYTDTLYYYVSQLVFGQNQVVASGSLDLDNILGDLIFYGNFEVVSILAYQSIIENDNLISQIILITNNYLSIISQVNINLKTQLQTGSLECYIPPYGDWNIMPQIIYYEETFSLVYTKNTSAIIGLYDILNCKQQNILYFTIGFPLDINQNSQQLPMVLYDGDGDSQQHKLALMTIKQQKSSQPVQYYFYKQLNVTINTQGKNIAANETIYLVAQNNFTSIKIPFFLLGNIANDQQLEWFVWVIIGIGMSFILAVIFYLIIRSRRMSDYYQSLN